MISHNETDYNFQKRQPLFKNFQFLKPFRFAYITSK